MKTIHRFALTMHSASKIVGNLIILEIQKNVMILAQENNFEPRKYELLNNEIYKAVVKTLSIPTIKK